MAETGFYVAGRIVTPPQSLNAPVGAAYRLFGDGVYRNNQPPLLQDVGGVLHKICPDQFRSQEFTKLCFRIYKVLAQLPNGWTLRLLFLDGEALLHLEFVPPGDPSESAGGAL